MDYADRLRADFGLARLSLGIRELPAKIAKRLPFPAPLRVPRAPRSVRAATYLVIALTLGFQGYELSKKEARDAWERENPPSLHAWEFALAPLGFRIEKNPESLQRALRRLPSRVEGDESAIWLSSDHAWVALLQTSLPDGPPAILCKTCSEPPKNWEPAGRGWQALNRMVEQLRSEPRTIPKAKIGRAPEWSDPRELKW